MKKVPLLQWSACTQALRQVCSWWGSTCCRVTRYAATARWDPYTGFILRAHWFLFSGKASRDHGRLETTVVHSTFLAILSAVFQWVVILINSTDAKTFPGEEAHTQRFPEAAASHLDAVFVWFHLQKPLGFITMLLCDCCVLKSWLLWWTQPMTGLRRDQFRCMTSRKASCRAQSSLCQLFSTAVMTQCALRRGRQCFHQQYRVRGWCYLCNHNQPGQRKSLVEALPKPGVFIQYHHMGPRRYSQGHWGRTSLTDRWFNLPPGGLCLLFTIFSLPVIASK